MLSPKRQELLGFSLVELLVALLVMGFIAILSYGAFDNVLQFEERNKDIFLKQNRVHLAQSVMLNDLLHLRARPVRDSLGGQMEAYLAPNNNYIATFTRGGLPDFQGMQGGIQRVAYRVEQGRLIRTTWEVVDQSPVTETTDYVLAEGITRLLMEHLDFQGNYSVNWPPVNQPAKLQTLPRAIRVTLELEEGDNLELLVPTSGATVVNMRP